MSEVYKPTNQERDPRYNMEPGIAIVQGSPYALEMQKFEQFPSKYGGTPGNPYVYREFPRMLYRAQLYNGALTCMAAPPNPLEFADPREYERKDELARKFSESCTRVVNTEAEMQRAFEDNWRKTPAEAVAALEGREKSRADAAAHRNYEDRSMSDKAKAEIKAEAEARGGEHIAEMPVQRAKRKYTRRAKPAA